MTNELVLTGPERELLVQVFGNQLPLVLDPEGEPRNPRHAALVIYVDGKWVIMPIGRMTETERLATLTLCAHAVQAECGSFISWRQVNEMSGSTPQTA